MTSNIYFYLSFFSPICLSSLIIFNPSSISHISFYSPYFFSSLVLTLKTFLCNISNNKNKISIWWSFNISKLAVITIEKRRSRKQEKFIIHYHDHRQGEVRVWMLFKEGTINFHISLNFLCEINCDFVWWFRFGKKLSNRSWCKFNVTMVWLREIKKWKRRVHW